MRIIKMTSKSAAAAALAVFALMVAPVPTWTQEEIKLDALYKDLASHNNYPVAQGLKRATADVSCNVLTQVVGAFPEAAGAPVKVTYTWSRPSESSWPEKKFEVTGIPAGLADLSKRADMIFQEPKDFVIEDPVYWTIAQTEASARQDGNRITVTGSGAQITSLRVDIDQATHQVQKMVMKVGDAEIVFEMTREKVGERWGVKSLVLTNPQATRLITYEYAEVNGFWLPRKISLEYKGTTEPTFVYEFSNWRVEV
jgi:hypothetical protein